MPGASRLFALSLVALTLAACAWTSAMLSPQPAPDPYAATDAHALAAPAAARTSVASLAVYLSEAAGSEREKARAIFRWITANVDYAQDEALGRVTLDGSPEAVLARGTAVCGGYADLFTALAQAVGLEAVSIKGFAKGHGFGAGDRVNGLTNHAWNAVKIGGEWRLLDCTWGAGAIERGAYTKGFNPFYFLTPARQFGWLHFPTDARWQLVTPPLTLAEFEDLPLVRDPFFRYGLGLAGQPSATIVPRTRDVTIRITSPPDVILAADERCPGALGGPRPLRIHSRRGQHSIQVDPPKSGECTVRIFATRASEAGAREIIYHWALEYRILPLSGPADRPRPPAPREIRR